MRVAIVHERLDVMGGAERVILALSSLYPDAPIFTSFVNRNNLPDAFRRIDIRTSFMQRFPERLKQHNDKLLPFYMFAFQEFDLSDYDVVISSSYAAAKGILTSSGTCHICYCHTPLRFAWDLYPSYMNDNGSRIMKMGARLLLHHFRLWDVQTANNVDYFVANSDTVRRRIRKNYRRDSVVIHPPVETRRFKATETSEDFYLVVSQLVPYKRIDLAIQAFNRLGRRLVVIGAGREEKRLAALAGPNVQLMGWQSDATVSDYLSRAKALIFPGEEDFGILPVEAQAAGTPVIALGRGGAVETVLNGETGLFFDEQTEDSLVRAVQDFERRSYDRLRISAHACQFDESVFRRRMAAYVNQCYKDYQEEQRNPLPLHFLTGESMETHNDIAVVQEEVRTR